jgi:hypothetical protein
MQKLFAALVAATLAFGSPAFAADAPSKDKPTAAPAKLEKPANVTPDAWAKMTDAEKQKAVAAATAPKTAAAPKKEKKGGC